MNAQLGAIADDFTGATDVAVAFRRAGMRTVLSFGAPESGLELPPHDAYVVGLKSRTIPAETAVELSLAALAALRADGVDQVFFKYCSTFDSTPEGNIGPVLEALLEHVPTPCVVTTPSSPEHGRTVRDGILFVDGVPLEHTHMRHHPLTPMTRSYVPELLAEQVEHGVTRLPLETVRGGAQAIVAALADVDPDTRFAVADAVDERDLSAIAEAIGDVPLVAGAAGLAGALAAARGAADARPPERDGDTAMQTVVLSGSCSQRTLEQLDALVAAGRPMFRLDALEHPAAEALAASAIRWWESVPADEAPVIFSSLARPALAEVQARLGVEGSASILEGAMGLIASELRSRGVRRFVCAGGETSGAIVTALGIDLVTIGEEEARGVPWLHTFGEDAVTLLLKSGNFGDIDLLVRASRHPGEGS